ncbi:hypothetical protein NIES4071_81090 [Calothrix sp. NIES-4071]|nr:hypothetical protein NIES4071_81090 [Calothrix sp. NIES-4071]BAZ62379.1 hypothetical protein NIES4105_81020 [Calothrix sp. NIES-4105]
MNLTSEEEEIIRRYRQLDNSRKKAIITSENSFVQWIKETVRWVWEKIKDFALTALFNWLRYKFLL